MDVWIERTMSKALVYPWVWSGVIAASGLGLTSHGVVKKE
jgi:hypothetical protein